MRERFCSRQSRMKATWRKERERTAARRKWIGKKRKTRREIRGLSERAALSWENQGGDWNVKFSIVVTRRYSNSGNFLRGQGPPRFFPTVARNEESWGTRNFQYMKKKNLETLTHSVFQLVKGFVNLYCFCSVCFSVSDIILNAWRIKGSSNKVNWNSSPNPDDRQ